MDYEDFNKVEVALMKLDFIRQVTSMMGDSFCEEMSVVLGETHDAIEGVFRQVKEDASPIVGHTSSK